MKNPFRVGEKVITRVAGAETEGIVTQLWQNEVQVRTADNELRWRSMYTVWRAGEAPLERTKAPSPSVAIRNQATDDNKAADPAAPSDLAAAEPQSNKRANRKLPKSKSKRRQRR